MSNSNHSEAKEEMVRQLMDSDEVASLLKDKENEEKPPLTPEELKKLVGYKTHAEILATPNKEWLIDGVLGKHDFALVFGRAKSGKTRVIFSLMFEGLVGGTFATKVNVNRKLKIAYLTNEGNDLLTGDDGLIESFRKKYDISPEELDERFMYFDKVPQLFDDNADFNPDVLIDFIKLMEIDVDIIIVDPQRNATLGAKENSSDDGATINDKCKKVINALHTAFMLAHHTGYSNRHVRGNSGLEGHADSMIKCDFDGDNPSTTTIRWVDHFLSKSKLMFSRITYRIVDNDIAWNESDASTNVGKFKRFLEGAKDGEQWYTLEDIVEELDDDKIKLPTLKKQISANWDSGQTLKITIDKRKRSQKGNPLEYRCMAARRIFGGNDG